MRGAAPGAASRSSDDNDGLIDPFIAGHDACNRLFYNDGVIAKAPKLPEI